MAGPTEGASAPVTSSMVEEDIERNVGVNVNVRTSETTVDTVKDDDHNDNSINITDGCHKVETTTSWIPASRVNSATTAASSAIGIDDEILVQLKQRIPDFTEQVKRAQRATDFEHQMTPMESVRLYWRAIVFSVILSMALVMEGYDTSLILSFFAFPEFRKKFGAVTSDGSYQVSSQWQAGLNNGASVGEIFGLMAAGVIADRYGYKKTMIGALIMTTCCIFLFFFAQNIGMLFAAEVLCGLPWGAFQTLTTTYAAEISPVVLRPYLTTYVNLCWVTGQFISSGVIRGLLNRNDEWAWRIPYALQWVWPIPLLVGVAFAPESPWWLVRHGRNEEAKRSISRMISHKGSEQVDLDDAIALINITNQHERIMREGVSYWECFKGIDLRRTEIVCCVWIIQITCGIGYAGSIPYFLEQVGFTSQQAFDFGVGQNGIAWLGTVCSWFVMQKVGRRSLYVWGLVIMCLSLLVVGFLGIPSGESAAISYSSAAFLLIFVFTYDLTVGPVCYCLVSEMSSARLRIKSVVLARNCYNIAGIMGNFLTPAILNPTAWNLRGRGGFIWAALCALSLIWTFYRLPEPRGRTATELDVLFEKRVAARKFATTNVDPFRSVNFSAVSHDIHEDVPVVNHEKA